MSESAETKMTVKTAGDAPASPKTSASTPAAPAVNPGDDVCAGDTAQPTGFGAGGDTPHKTEA